MATSEDSERRLSEAMRAQASGLGHPGFAGRPTAAPLGHRDAPAPAASPGLWAELSRTRVPLLLALIGGIVLGIALALVSLLAPGLLPPLG